MTDVGEIYDEDDFRPAMSDGLLETEKNNDAKMATPESRRSNAPLDPLEEAEAAAAAAEVSLMEGNQTTNNRGRDQNADRALMGGNADGVDDGIRAHEATDESGELVRGAFEEFLQN